MQDTGPQCGAYREFRTLAKALCACCAVRGSYHDGQGLVLWRTFLSWVAACPMEGLTCTCSFSLQADQFMQSLIVTVA